jgi:hypothetical protein
MQTREEIGGSETRKTDEKDVIILQERSPLLGLTEHVV